MKTPPGSWTEVTTTPITAFGAPIAGLAENTEYEVQVRATNAEGTGDWSDPPGRGATDANAAPFVHLAGDVSTRRRTSSRWGRSRRRTATPATA